MPIAAGGWPRPRRWGVWGLPPPISAHLEAAAHEEDAAVPCRRGQSLGGRPAASRRVRDPASRSAPRPTNFLSQPRGTVLSSPPRRRQLQPSPQPARSPNAFNVTGGSEINSPYIQVGQRWALENNLVAAGRQMSGNRAWRGEGRPVRSFSRVQCRQVEWLPRTASVDEVDPYFVRFSLIRRPAG